MPTKRRFALPFTLLILALPCVATLVHADAASTSDLSSAAGAAWEFKPEGGGWKAIEVPAGGWRTQGYTCDAGTYRTTLTLPTYAGGERVRLAFDAINFGAKIYAGKDEAGLQLVAEHIDGWVPVKADLTPVAAPGEKLLVQVEVAGRKKLMANGKFLVPEGASWYPGLEEGILRGVRLEIVPAVRVEDVFVRTSVGPDVLNAQVTLANDTDAPAAVSLAPAVESANGANYPYPKMTETTCQLPAKTTRTVDLGDVPWTAGAGSYWWPNVPYRPGFRAQLHRLVLSVKKRWARGAALRPTLRLPTIPGRWQPLRTQRHPLQSARRQPAGSELRDGCLRHEEGLRPADCGQSWLAAGGG